MAKVIAICGKICSGKSYYANILREKGNAVILSCDEITASLFDNNLGDKHDEMTKRIREYLLKKSIELVKVDTNVILDWGFWTKTDREYITQYFKENNILCEWHYINIDDDSWQKNIHERNKKVLDGTDTNNFYLDEGLMQKLLTIWQEPSKNEIDVWYDVKR